MGKFRSPCSKCGSTDHSKWYRKAHGQYGYASYCIMCHREDQRIRNERMYAKNKENINARSSEIRKGNPIYQALARKSYWKNREKCLEKKREKYKKVDPTKDKRRNFSLIGNVRDVEEDLKWTHRGSF